MKLGFKVLIFISSIFLIASLFVYSIVNDNYKNIIEFENKLISSNMKKLLDNVYISSEALSKTLDIYSFEPNILKILNGPTNEKFQALFERDKFTHLFLLDENKEVIKGGVFNRSSEEFYNINKGLKLFKTNKNFLNQDQIYFTTYDFEKIIFSAIKIENPNLNFKYIVLGKALDSKFLSFITRLSDSYVSLFFDYDLKKTYKVNSLDYEYYYDIKRKDNHTLYAYIGLNDFLNNKNFYLSMKIDRVFFSKIMKNNETIFYIFVAALILLLISLYVFITKFFTNRIETITNNVKSVSENKQLKTKIRMDYNDEITYLANKINDMLISIDISQHENLKKERDFLQSVIDAQQSIILITDGNDIKSTNKRFNEHFDSTELFLTNVALLDKKAKDNFLEIIKNYDSYDKPAKIKVSDNKDGYFTFDIKRIDFKNYIINMNDVSRISKQINNLKQKASFDQLTNVYNKNTILSIAKEWFKYKNFAIIILDIDFFKKINDTYGHLIGDYILRDTSKLLNDNLRQFDIIGRFGGEEFIILIENINLENINNICENLRELIQNHNFIYEGKTIKITASFGFTFSNKCNSFDESFKLADEALYNAKKTGRNRICNY